MQLLNRQPIRRQLLLAALALAVPFIGAVAWTADATRRDQQDRVKEQAASVAATAAAQLDSYLSGLDAMASAVARHPAVVSGDPANVAHLFADLLHSRPLITNLILIAPDGRIRAAATPLPAGYDRVGWSFIGDVIRTGEPGLTDYATSPTTGRGVVAMAYPVRNDEDEPVAVLVIGLDLVKLESVFASVPLPEGSVISVADRNGVVIARSMEADQYIGVATETPRMIPDAPPVSSLRTDIDGVERFYSDIAARRGAWTVSVGIPGDIVPARLRPMWERNLSITLVMVATIIVLSLVMAWQTTTHLNRLRNAAQRIAAGDLTPLHPVTTPNREFGELQDTFIQMSAKLREARDALDRQMDQERKMNEMLQSLQRQVVRQERLAAVGLLVSGVAHEVNNPLQGILGTAELLEHEPGLSQQMLEEIAFLKTQAGRAREIIRNLSRFSSQQSGPPVLLDLKDVIEEVVQLRQRDLDSAHVALDVQVSGHRKVHANFTELEQVMLNFVINAQQAIEGSQAVGRVLIRLLDVGRKVRLEVHDNGPGVKKEDEAKLFQPFFTTKPVGKGTGLGLSVSYGIIDAYGGTIGYSKNEWGGATFYFELPAAGTENDDANDRPAVLHGSL